MSPNSTSTSGLRVARELRAARDAAGLTRAALAAEVGCSYSALSLLEAGCVPKRSRVLRDALAVLASYNGDDRAASPLDAQEANDAANRSAT